MSETSTRDGWYPMDNAPRDGSIVRITWRDARAQWREGEGNAYAEHNRHFSSPPNGNSWKTPAGWLPVEHARVDAPTANKPSPVQMIRDIAKQMEAQLDKSEKSATERGQLELAGMFLALSCQAILIQKVSELVDDSTVDSSPVSESAKEQISLPANAEGGLNKLTTMLEHYGRCRAIEASWSTGGRIVSSEARAEWSSSAAKEALFVELQQLISKTDTAKPKSLGELTLPLLPELHGGGYSAQQLQTMLTEYAEKAVLEDRYRRRVQE